MILLSNPVDVLTRVAIETSTRPAHRVLGSGTVLDGARLRQRLGELLGAAAKPGRRSRGGGGRDLAKAEAAVGETRSIGSYAPPAAAKRCSCSNGNTLGGLVSPRTRGSPAFTRTPATGNQR